MRAVERPRRRRPAGILPRVLGLLLGTGAGLLPAGAVSLDEAEIHGFVSPGAFVTTDNNYLAISRRGTFDFSEAAVNLTHPLGETLQFGLQLFTRDLGRIGDYSARFDWYYLDWRRYDWLRVRAGRVKIPFGLFNETSDFDPGRLQILLPQSVYPLTSRDFLLASTGVQVYGDLDLGTAGLLSYAVLGGTIFVELGGVPPPGSVIETRYVAGGRLLWESTFGLRAAASALNGRLDFDTPVGGQPVAGDLPFFLWVGSLDYVRGPLRLSAEYSRWTTTIEGNNPAVLPNGTTVSERGYVASAWTVTDLVQLGLYWSVLFPDVRDRSDREDYQHDVALSFRRDLGPHWLVKLEGHYLHGTAALDPVLNGGVARSALVEDWVLVLVKTTAYF